MTIVIEENTSHAAKEKGQVFAPSAKVLIASFFRLQVTESMITSLFGYTHARVVLDTIDQGKTGFYHARVRITIPREETDLDRQRRQRSDSYTTPYYIPWIVQEITFVISPEAPYRRIVWGVPQWKQSPADLIHALHSKRTLAIVEHEQRTRATLRALIEHQYRHFFPLVPNPITGSFNFADLSTLVDVGYSFAIPDDIQGLEAVDPEKITLPPTLEEYAAYLPERLWTVNLTGNEGLLRQPAFAAEPESTICD